MSKRLAFQTQEEADARLAEFWKATLRNIFAYDADTKTVDVTEREHLLSAEELAVVIDEGEVA
jgi:hypothetical protein